MNRDSQTPFLNAFNIIPHDVISIIGAGGKTSLIFCLAQEARRQGMKVLVSTTTHMLIPPPDTHDFIDLSGTLFSNTPVLNAGIYVAGTLDSDQNKMTGTPVNQLDQARNRFDLVLIEADGAAGKSLKGWNETEPVIPPFTTKTIGVVDIQAVGRQINHCLVHRLEIFMNNTQSRKNELVNTNHIAKIVDHDNGMFGKSSGDRIVFINKVETTTDGKNCSELCKQLYVNHVVSGSIHRGVAYGKY